MLLNMLLKFDIFLTERSFKNGSDKKGGVVKQSMAVSLNYEMKKCVLKRLIEKCHDFRKSSNTEIWRAILSNG